MKGGTISIVFITMREVAACLLGPYLAHIGAEVYKGDILSNSSPRKNIIATEVRLQCRACCQFVLKHLVYKLITDYFSKQHSNT